MLLVLIAGFVMTDKSSSLGGYGEAALLAAGVIFGIMGLKDSE